VAFVTGGNGGLGRAVALGFRDRGARVAVTGRDAAKNAAIAAELGEAGIALAMDLRDEDAVAGCVAATVERLGRIDVLVNDAGEVRGARLPDFPIADWDALVGTHLRGAFLCAKHASGAMMAAGDSGKIINVSSVFGLFGPPGLAHRASAKAGVLGLTRAPAVELAPHRIRVNCLVPGFFETELALRNTTPERREEVRRRTPAGRWGRPEEIVGAALLLASRASDFTIGTSLVVDGGYVVSERLLYD